MQRFTEFDFGVSWVMGFFHQDWTYEADTAAEVVAQHLPEGAGEEALAVRRDARTLVDNLPSETLEVLWTAGSQYCPGFGRTTGAEWTRTVVGVCDTWLSEQSEVRPLTGADTEDGLTHRDAVVAEIEAMGFLAAEVRRALVDCAHHCTPDLALRVLLRVAVDTPGASLSDDRYKRLESIGSALHYGEFLVEDVKFLVADD
ncbi:contact-dependent growth inhibition system immunity protein [Streptomyces sp. QTS52]